MENFNEFCNSINWKKLAEQKKSLKIIKDTLNDSSYEIINNYTPQIKKFSQHKKLTHIKNLKNLLDFIDKLQSVAIDKHGVSMNDVYPISEKINLIFKSKENFN